MPFPRKSETPYVVSYKNEMGLSGILEEIPLRPQGAESTHKLPTVKKNACPIQPNL